MRVPDTAAGVIPLLAQQDWSAVQAWVERHFWAVFWSHPGTPLGTALEQTLAAVPASVLSEHSPGLAVLRARWHASADFTAAIEHLDAVFHRATDDAPARALAVCAVLEATLARAQSASIASRWIDRLHAVRTQLDAPHRDLELFMAAAELAGALLLGQTKDVDPALIARSVTLLKMHPHRGARAIAIDALLQHSLFGRDLPTLRWVVGQIDHHAVVDDLLPTSRWRHIDALAGAYFVLDRHADNQRVLDEGAERAIAEGHQQAASACLCALAQAALGRRDAERAAAAIDRHERIVDAAEPSDLAMVAANRAMLGRLRQDAGEAERHARDAVRYAELAELAAYERSAYYSLHAMTLTDLERYAEAADRLEASAQLGPADYGRLARVEAPLLRRLGQDGDERETARLVVRQLQELAPEHFERLFPNNDAVFARVARYALMGGGNEAVWAALVEQRGVAPPPHAGAHWPWALRLRLLGTLELGSLDDDVKPSRRAAGKPIELLQALAAHAPAGLSVTQLADALWPHAEADLAARNLDVTLVRLRQRLGRDDLVERRAGRLSLALDRLWCDCGELAQRYEAGTLPSLAEMLDLYRGPLLPDLDHEWVLERRRTLARQAQHVLTGLMERHLALGDIDAVVRAFEPVQMRRLDIETIVQTALERLALNQREAMIAQLPLLVPPLEAVLAAPAARMRQLARRWGVEMAP